MRAIKKIKPESRFVGHGGDGMTKEGLERMYHTDQLGILGFSEVIVRLPFMLTAMNRSPVSYTHLTLPTILLV